MMRAYHGIIKKWFAFYFQTMAVRSSDVWVVTQPKCGTTWTQEMVWCIMNDLDFVKAKETILDERVKYFE